MSGLANLYAFARTPDEMAVWSFANMAQHRDINRLISDQYGEQLSEFILDPFDPGNAETWLSQHGQMHQEMCGVLGIDGYNLFEVDWENIEDLQSWWTQHADEHYRASRLLGLE